MRRSSRFFDEIEVPDQTELERLPRQEYLIEDALSGRLLEIDRDVMTPDEAMVLQQDLFKAGRSTRDPVIRKIDRISRKEAKAEADYPFRATKIGASERFIGTNDVLEALRLGVFSTKFLSMVIGGPQIFGKILTYKSKSEKRGNSIREKTINEYLNPYSLAHQEQQVLRQNASKLISAKGKRLVLLGAAYAIKDLLYIEMTDKPVSADIIDISQEFGEAARRALADRGGVRNVRIHNKNYMAGDNSVWDKNYYEKQILKGDLTPVLILSFGHGRFNEGTEAYEQGLAAMRAVMRPQDSFGEGANLTQHYYTLKAEYNEARDTEPDEDGNFDLWEKLGKRMLAGTVGRVAGCTNLDMKRIWRQIPDIRVENGCTVVRLHLSTYDHPRLTYRELRADNIPRNFGEKIEYVKTPRPTEALLRVINNRTGFALVGNKMLRVQGHLCRPDLKPDVVFMQVVPV